MHHGGDQCLRLPRALRGVKHFPQLTLRTLTPNSIGAGVALDVGMLIMPGGRERGGGH